MKQILGLDSYIMNPKYRNALQLPNEVTEVYEFLARGEYNVNYSFIHPLSNKKLVLRVNIGSQMHLEHQIEYEYNVLDLLSKSNRTPKPIYVDGSRQYLPYGILVMEFVNGHHLDYKTELMEASKTLADIHSVEITNAQQYLIHPENPLKAILEECEEMVSVYYQSPLALDEQKNFIKMLMKAGWDKLETAHCPTPYECCINTELNSTNFLVNAERTYLVDWEKPLIGDPAQDLGHYLAPTTTFWKTDIILEWNCVDEFIEDYIKQVNLRFDTSGLKERVNLYIPVTCLRGITWCAMAWIQYQEPDKLIKNKSTWNKLSQYLEINFLHNIYKNFFQN